MCTCNSFHEEHCETRIWPGLSLIFGQNVTCFVSYILKLHTVGSGTCEVPVCYHRHFRFSIFFYKSCVEKWAAGCLSKNNRNLAHNVADYTVYHILLLKLPQQYRAPFWVTKFIYLGNGIFSVRSDNLLARLIWELKQALFLTIFLLQLQYAQYDLWEKVQFYPEQSLKS